MKKKVVPTADKIGQPQDRRTTRSVTACQSARENQRLGRDLPEDPLTKAGYARGGAVPVRPRAPAARAGPPGSSPYQRMVRAGVSVPSRPDILGHYWGAPLIGSPSPSNRCVSALGDASSSGDTRT